MLELNEIEARVLGCLIEKSLSTPELYPLTLNSLVNACNQKSSRDPVMELDEAAVGKGLFTLLERGLGERVHESGSRVPKFKHHAEELLKSSDPKETAALCVLLLRGPQTPGEIKTRTDRLCQFADTAEAAGLLQQIALRGQDPWVAQLPRQSGQKEARYQQLFTGPAPAEMPPPPRAPASVPAQSDRLAELERRVLALEGRIKKLEGLGRESIGGA